MFGLQQTSESLEVSNIAFILKDTVKSLKGSLVELVPNIDTVVGDMKKNLLEPLKTKTETTSTAETQTITHRPEPSGIHPILPPLMGGPPPQYRERMYVHSELSSSLRRFIMIFVFDLQHRRSLADYWSR